jgi:hypothetical protein
MDTSLSRKALHGYQPLKERPCMDTSLSWKALHGYQPLKERPCMDTSLSWKALWRNLYGKLVLFV